MYKGLSKAIYHVNMKEGMSLGATSQAGEGPVQESTVETNQPARGWALKQTKKAGRFSHAQNKYLEEKFSIGQQTGHKLDPVSVARDMPYAKNFDGNWLFTRSEFLTAQQSTVLF